MVYWLIIFFQLLGIGFHVMQKIVSLGDTFKATKTRGEIWNIFWSEDWDVTGISALIILLNLGVHFVVFDYQHMALPDAWYWPLLDVLGIPLILGYAGQRLIYKWFGSAEQFLDKQVTDRLQ